MDPSKQCGLNLRIYRNTVALHRGSVEQPLMDLILDTTTPTAIQTSKNDRNDNKNETDRIGWIDGNIVRGRSGAAAGRPEPTGCKTDCEAAEQTKPWTPV
eukprot:8242288-Pyramimonas_sp.AAC.1